MIYEIEKINATNKKEIIIRTNPDNTKRVYPAEGYRWANPSDRTDFSVVKITNNDREAYASAMDLSEIASTFFKAGNWDQAILYCSLSLNKEASYLAYFIRAMSYIQKKLYDKALEDLGNTLNFELDNQLYGLVYLLKADVLLSKQEYAETINVSNQAINSLNLSNDLFSTALASRATAKYSLKQYNSALIDFNRSIELDSENSVAYINRGVVKYRLNDSQGAIADYTSAINIHNRKSNLDAIDKIDLSTAYQGRAFIKYEAENFQDALQDVNTALKLNSDNSRAYFIRGLIKIKIGFKESGCSDFNKAKVLGLSVVEDLNEYKNNCK